MVSVASRKVSRAPRYSGIDFESSSFSPTWLSHPMAPLSSGIWLTTRLVTLLLPTLQPLCHPKVIQVWANSDFARHYFRNHGCFIFLRVLRWFTSPGWLRHPMNSDDALEDFPRGVAPFGNLRVKACLRLTGAYRSLPRPSSPSCAKASTVRP